MAADLGGVVVRGLVGVLGPRPGQPEHDRLVILEKSHQSRFGGEVMHTWGMRGGVGVPDPPTPTARGAPCDAVSRRWR